ncbi:glycerol-3-phosphate dehydrogenase/oxidase [Marinobacter daqiaonensis]|nr:glycerol-3-phosphate dehydrogenase/oxidase [Marinobacter daqiaonensis]
MSRKLTDLNPDFDIIVIGGGITGAGVAREAAAAGLRTLLVEQKDYAWGTSSRSSKMVHGGLRYLAGGHIGLTRDAVRERQRMLDEAPGLVERMRYVMPHYRKRFPGPRLFGLVLAVYDFFAGERYRHRIQQTEMLQWLPGLSHRDLLGATGFTDAVTEDARLVMRILDEARSRGATTLNYVAATEVSKPGDRHWSVTLEDRGPGQSARRTVDATLVVNATGAWADRLWPVKDRKEHIRPLRGSHLVLPFHRLPVSVALTIPHPRDKRPVFIYPWLGRTVVGTTDLDHRRDLDLEPAITSEEVGYLFEAANSAYPGCSLDRGDIISTWSGVRPVVSSQDTSSDLSPSKENREHVIWDDDGLISVAGGKLTTFRLIAREILLTGTPYLNTLALADESEPVFPPADGLPRPETIRHLTWRRLQGQFGRHLPRLLEAGPLAEVPTTEYLWAELHWAASHESVIHLDDLLLRRTRLGLILPGGGVDLLAELKQRLQPDLGWDDDHWAAEEQRYLTLWRTACFLPEESPEP